MKYLWGEKKILRLVIATAAVGFGFNVATATAVLFMRDTLGVSEAAYGVVLLGGALGALLGAIISPKLSKRFGRGTVLAWSITLTTIFEALQGLSPNVYYFMVFSFIAGLNIAAWNVLLMSVYHTLIPNELFGRVHGARRTLVWGMMPLGALVGGIIAKVDLRLPYLVGGLLSLAVAIHSFRFIRQLGNSSEST
jgi:MFS family permease